MKICKVIIENYQQFKHLELDFTHPETGEPLDNICFIGSNGTGKSTLLNLLLRGVTGAPSFHSSSPFSSFEFDWNGERYVLGNLHGTSFFVSKKRWVKQKSIPFYDPKNPLEIGFGTSFYLEPGLKELYHYYPVALTKQAVIIKVEAESDINTYKQINDVPPTSLSEVRAKTYDTDHIEQNLIDQSTITEFWNNIISHISQREQQRNEFENQPENLSKTKRQLIDEFDQANPKILDKLAVLWNHILEKAGLEFDVENAKLPIQLTDNLYAYIKLKATGERINYNQLSTGIRNFIFRIGHIYSLYFNQKIENGFLFVDEPENSLFPDFLLDLIDIYKEITTDKNGERNTQMFFATHNPIVAAQFEPYERVILEWTEDGSVTARRGTAPIGDDPNDVLIKDFEISSLMPQAGVAMWEKYLDLKRKLRNTTDDNHKEELVTEILEIGSEYNFPRDQPKP